MAKVLQHINSEDILSLSLKVCTICCANMETDYSVSFPIFQANSLATKEYVKELTPQEKKQQKFKEKRLKDWNKNRVKREFVPKIRPHKPLWPVCYQISFHCAFCLEGNLGAIRSENRKNSMFRQLQNGISLFRHRTNRHFLFRNLWNIMETTPRECDLYRVAVVLLSQRVEV